MRRGLPPTASQVSGSRYCVLSRSTLSGKSLRLVMAGHEVCDPDYAVRREGYPTLALEIVEQGGGSLILGGKSHALRPGMVFTYGPGIPHEIRAIPGMRLVKSFIDFTGLEGERLLRQAGLQPGHVAMARDAEAMLRIIGLMLRRAGGVSPANRALCADYLRALLRLASETVPLGREAGSSPDCHRRALDLIESDHASLRSVAELARRLGVTPEHLARSFKAMGEESPLRLLSTRRLNHAANLLLSGAAQVKGVAAELGYANPFHFSTAFKRHFGFSPTSLRRRHRGEAPGA